MRITVAVAAALVWTQVGARAQERLPLRSGWTLAAAAPGGGRPESSEFRPAPVPGTFEEVLGPGFDGVAWYRRTLRAPPEWRGRRVWLEFHGAATEAVVFLDGVEIASHLGAWTTFRARLDPALQPGVDHVLEVRVDEKVGYDTQGFLPVIQPHFGGLWQDVELCLASGPTVDRTGLMLFGDGETLRVDVPVLAGTSGNRAGLRVEVLDGARTVAAVESTVAAPGRARLGLAVPGARRWSPQAPHVYRGVVTLKSEDGRRVWDRVEAPVAFRDLRVKGTTILWNDRPLQMRGVLHWGFSPPRFAPHPDRDRWRRELEELRARGFNCLKCCLWVPPRELYEVALEVGMLIWQEYPTWHPRIVPERREALVAEFEEMFAHDRPYPNVAFRSLTCETGHGADAGILRELYERAHRAVPSTLVIDDSSWISWSRVGDFYDEHPYGNNRWWPRRLREMREFVAEHGAKPLLLGECIAADTWFDLDSWRLRHGRRPRWWQPRCLEAQVEFEHWVEKRFGRETLESLLPVSLGYAMRNRKYQIERLRIDWPEAGYVVSVIRDFPLARMGLWDDFGRAKFDVADWAWHGDTTIALDTEGDRRGFLEGEARVAVRVAHHGATPLRGTLVLAADGAEIGRRAVSLPPGTVSSPLAANLPGSAAQGLRRVRVTARVLPDGAANAWDVWVLPRFEDSAPRGTRIVRRLDADTVEFLTGGGRVLLLADGRRGSLRTQALWYLRGAPLLPPHPVHEKVPRELLEELQTFDLEAPRVMFWDALRDQVDPILAFWETHDLDEVRSWLLAFDCRVGRGRLLATALDHETPAGRFVLSRFLEHLAHGPPPRHALGEETVRRLAAEARREVVELERWELRFDPHDRGLQEGYPAGGPETGWTRVRAGAHWEAQGFPDRDGVAWYRTEVTVPAGWAKKPVLLVLEGVDDSFRLYVDGREVARRGDPDRGETVWLQRQVVDLTGVVAPGRRYRLILRVVDHGGAGGLWKPVWLTNGPPDAEGRILH